MLNRTLWTPQQMLIRPLDTKKKNERLKCPEVGLGCWISRSPRGREPSEPGILNRPLDTLTGDAREATRTRFRPQTTPSDPGPSRIGENKRRPSRWRSTFRDLQSRANHRKASQTSSSAKQTPMATFRNHTTQTGGAGGREDLGGQTDT